MGYFSCNAESAIATCDPNFWDLNNTKKNSTSRTIRKFHYTDLVAATNSFSADNFLGKGSHGNVYKATVDDGKLIAAVKTTKLTTKTPTSRHHITTCTGCGHCTSPAENEIEILSHVNSPRIVNLIGFSTDPNDNKLIVVQYMPNGSLHDLLHSPVQPPGWTHRIRFALQVAKAVHTLHSSNPPIIHRDIKSSNILIDYDRKARLGDFGLALRGHVEDVRVKCTPPAGTLGYLDPCYLAPGDLSAKSDVFSFGILLLEILSGRNAIDVNYSPPSVVDWAVPLIKRGEFAGIYDRRIGPPMNDVVMRQLAVLAARCVRSTAEKRPSMAEVVEWVNNARKRMGAVPVWSGLKRRVARVERFEVFECGDVDRSEEVVKGVKGVSRRNGKVSSVAGVEYKNEPSNEVNRVVRCKSIGFGSIMKRGLDPNVGGYPTGIERKKGKIRLKKSKSMGFLHGPSLLHDGNGNENNYKSGPIHLVEMAMTKLVITHKLEEKMLETPLVGNLSNPE